MHSAILYFKNLIKPQLFRKNVFNLKVNRLSTVNPTLTEDDGNFFKDEMADLKAHYPILAKDLTSYISQYKEFPGLLERFPQLLDYTVPNEDPYFLTTALIPLYSYKAIEEPDKMTEENLKKACIMAWVYRILEVSQIIVDDIIDHSDVRYNKPVWCKKDGVSLELAVLDSHYLATGAYLLLMKHLENHQCCLDIVHLYMEKMFITFITQFMDVDNIGVKLFLKAIPLRFDKALYIFDGSIRSALYLANINDKETHEAMKKFTIPMSRFFQLQNDFSGVFVGENKFQRICPDIIDGRNSWLVATALRMASPSQKKIIEENYGNGDPESAKKVVEVYWDLKLNEVHEKRSKEFSEEMYNVVENFPKRIPKQPFHDMAQQLVLNKLYS
ncbi:unnamed protein product [Psylliodes chrysocephalus]|uniref:Terpene synthase n=1 Tax=Psylliodes chrysocephalus TaxID=3402493 RepID=A0A9P0CH82_9CUCU|nr:unnamed protein product [Psylliodes chrysocephala]